MRGKPLLFICILCLVLLAACTPPSVVPSTGSGSAGSVYFEPTATPVPSGTPTSSSSSSVTSIPMVSTTVPGGPVVSGGTSEPGTAVPLPVEGGGVITGGGKGPKGIITPAPEGNLSVTLNDQGKTVQLKVGQTFLLNLGPDYDWSPVVADQSVVSRVPNITVIRGAQGIYKAHQVGKTTLTATGDPTCLQSTPRCAKPSLIFTITIEVQ